MRLPVPTVTPSPPSSPTSRNGHYLGSSSRSSSSLDIKVKIQSLTAPVTTHKLSFASNEQPSLTRLRNAILELAASSSTSSGLDLKAGLDLKLSLSYLNISDGDLVPLTSQEEWEQAMSTSKRSASKNLVVLAQVMQHQPPQGVVSAAPAPSSASTNLEERMARMEELLLLMQQQQQPYDLDISQGSHRSATATSVVPRPTTPTRSKDYTAIVKDHQASLASRVNKVKQMNSAAATPNSPARINGSADGDMPKYHQDFKDYLQMALQEQEERLSERLEEKVTKLLLATSQDDAFELEKSSTSIQLAMEKALKEWQPVNGDSSGGGSSGTSDRMLMVVSNQLQQRMSVLDAKLDAIATQKKNAGGGGTDKLLMIASNQLQHRMTALQESMEGRLDELEKKSSSNSSSSSSSDKVVMIAANQIQQRLSAMQQQLEARLDNQQSVATTNNGGGNDKVLMVVSNQIQQRLSAMDTKMDQQMNGLLERLESIGGGATTPTAASSSASETKQVLQAVCGRLQQWLTGLQDDMKDQMSGVKNEVEELKGTVELQAVAGGRKLVTVTVDKAPGERLGITLTEENDNIYVDRISERGLLYGTAIKAGMEIYTVNDIPVAGKTMREVLKILKDAIGNLTIVAFKTNLNEEQQKEATTQLLQQVGSLQESMETRLQELQQPAGSNNSDGASAAKVVMVASNQIQQRLCAMQDHLDGRLQALESGTAAGPPAAMTSSAPAAAPSGSSDKVLMVVSNQIQQRLNGMEQQLQQLLVHHHQASPQQQLSSPSSSSSSDKVVMIAANQIQQRLSAMQQSIDSRFEELTSNSSSGGSDKVLMVVSNQLQQRLSILQTQMEELKDQVQQQQAGGGAPSHNSGAAGGAGETKQVLMAVCNRLQQWLTGLQDTLQDRIEGMGKQVSELQDSVELQAVAGGRKLVTVTVDKAPGERLGITLTEENDNIYVDRISERGLLYGHAIKAGMEIYTVNDIPVAGKTMREVLKILKDAIGNLTIVAFKANASEEQQKEVNNQMLQQLGLLQDTVETRLHELSTQSSSSNNDGTARVVMLASNQIQQRLSALQDHLDAQQQGQSSGGSSDKLIMVASNQIQQRLCAVQDHLDAQIEKLQGQGTSGNTGSPDKLLMILTNQLQQRLSAMQQHVDSRLDGLQQGHGLPGQGNTGSSDKLLMVVSNQLQHRLSAMSQHLDARLDQVQGQGQCTPTGTGSSDKVVMIMANQIQQRLSTLQDHMDSKFARLTGEPLASVASEEDILSADRELLSALREHMETHAVKPDEKELLCNLRDHMETRIGSPKSKRRSLLDKAEPSPGASADKVVMIVGNQVQQRLSALQQHIDARFEKLERSSASNSNGSADKVVMIVGNQLQQKLSAVQQQLIQLEGQVQQIKSNDGSGGSSDRVVMISANQIQQSLSTLREHLDSRFAALESGNTAPSSGDTKQVLMAVCNRLQQWLTGLQDSMKEQMTGVRDQVEALKDTVELQAIAGGRKLITVTVDKAPGERLGITLTEENDNIYVDRISERGLLYGHAIKAGMEIYTVNDIPVAGKTMREVLKILKDAIGNLTIVAFKANATEEQQKEMGNQLLEQVCSLQASMDERFQELQAQPGSSDGSAKVVMVASNQIQQRLCSIQDHLDGCFEALASGQSGSSSDKVLMVVSNQIQQRLSALESQVEDLTEGLQQPAHGTGLAPSSGASSDKVVMIAANQIQQRLSAMQQEFDKRLDRLDSSRGGSSDGVLMVVSNQLQQRLSGLEMRLNDLHAEMKDQATNGSSGGSSEKVVMIAANQIQQRLSTMHQQMDSQFEALKMEGQATRCGPSSDKVVMVMSNMIQQRLSALQDHMNNQFEELQRQTCSNSSGSSDKLLMVTTNQLQQRLSMMQERIDARLDRLESSHSLPASSTLTTGTTCFSNAERSLPVGPSSSSSSSSSSASSDKVIMIVANQLQQKLSAMQEHMDSKFDEIGQSSHQQSSSIPPSSSSSSSSSDKVVMIAANQIQQRLSAMQVHIDARLEEIQSRPVIPSSSSSSDKVVMIAANQIQQRLSSLQTEMNNKVQSLDSNICKVIQDSAHQLHSQMAQVIGTKIAEESRMSRDIIIKNEKQYASALRQTMVRLHNETRNHTASLVPSSSDNGNKIVANDGRGSFAAAFSSATASACSLEAVKEAILSSHEMTCQSQAQNLQDHQIYLVEYIKAAQNTILSKLGGSNLSEAVLDESVSKLEKRLSTHVEQIQAQATAAILHSIEKQKSQQGGQLLRTQALETLAKGSGGSSVDTSKDLAISGEVTGSLTAGQMEELLLAAMGKFGLAMESSCEHIQAQATTAILDKVELSHETIAKAVEAAQGSTQELLSDEVDKRQRALSAKVDVVQSQLQNIQGCLEQRKEQVQWGFANQEQQEQQLHQQQQKQEQQIQQLPQQQQKPQQLDRQQLAPKSAMVSAKPRSGILRTCSSSSSQSRPMQQRTLPKSPRQQTWQKRDNYVQRERDLMGESKYSEDMDASRATTSMMSVSRSHAAFSGGGMQKQHDDSSIFMRRFMDMEARGMQLEKAYDCIKFNRPLSPSQLAAHEEKNEECKYETAVTFDMDATAYTNASGYTSDSHAVVPFSAGKAA